MNLSEVIKYQYGSDIDFAKDVIIFDDGDGQYIAQWNLPIPRPTIKDLKQIAMSADFLRWRTERASMQIDKKTGKSIDAAVHPFAGLEEQIGILRAQIAEILVALGLEPTDEFAKLNTIAAEKIQEARKKKEIIDAKDS